jgi:ribonuclease P protein component
LAPRSRKAVERNRIKRRLRAAWAEATPSRGLDAVIAADERSTEESFQDLVDHLKSALTRAESLL